MFDTHCHLNIEEFNDSYQDVIKDSINAGVDHILVPGVDSLTSKKALAISKLHKDYIFPAVGIHPSYSKMDSNWVEIKNIIDKNRSQIKAIGEIGLDYFRDYAPRASQLDMLKAMLDLARSNELPIVLHNRDADEDMINMLNNYFIAENNTRNPIGVFHAYDGSPIIKNWGLTHHFLFGIGGLVTYKKNEQLRMQIEEIGINHLVLETDSPYLSPTPFRGKTNSPKYLIYIAREISKIVGESVENVIIRTTENAFRLFGFN